MLSLVSGLSLIDRMRRINSRGTRFVILIISWTISGWFRWTSNHFENTVSDSGPTKYNKIARALSSIICNSYLAWAVPVNITLDPL
ncbi:hypothetical protein BCR41DRAFT_362248 [Lobosporangium transversale]|uniref:Uncharacterized protein n=1 Tax=Lobosporangium transversale TaxID=64571 RepID=A0A1Y2GA14_9FUNG|nr:hypothetical protein BCR41DRAFT_362248 [Lobosporangium transversale]ORZ05023.1 hypothetical protein BCR41DRAFT_362248 [Lobosporangium transversale]|eukprot:XP_021876887.1 hypothetical protein BCR41DRAFT_362248 [Lobosporangium transversale]